MVQDVVQSGRDVLFERGHHVMVGGLGADCEKWMPYGARVGESPGFSWVWAYRGAEVGTTSWTDKPPGLST